jgi:hypothetical protein
MLHASKCRTKRSPSSGVASSVPPHTRYAQRAIPRMRESIIPRRVSDVSVIGTERSGACARPLSSSRSGSRVCCGGWTQVRGVEVQGTESSESRCFHTGTFAPGQSAVFGVAEQRRPRRASMSIVAGSELTRQSPQSAGALVRQSRQRSRHLARVLSQARDEALSR